MDDFNREAMVIKINLNIPTRVFCTGQDRGKLGLYGISLTAIDLPGSRQIRSRLAEVSLLFANRQLIL